MRTSSDIRTSSIVLLAATVILGGLCVVLVTPLVAREDGGAMERQSFAEVKTASEANAAVSPPAAVPEFAEFFPAEQPRPLRQAQQSGASDTGFAPVSQSSLEDSTVVSQRSANDAIRNRAAAGAASASAHRHLASLPPVTAQANPAHARSFSNGRDLPNHNPRVLPAAASVPGSQSAVAEPFGQDAPTPDSASYPAARHYSATPSRVSGIATDRLAPGSVYAPVTVNLDSSILGQQLLGIEQRFQEALRERDTQQRNQFRALEAEHSQSRRSLEEERHYEAELQRQQLVFQQQHAQRDHQLAEIAKALQQLSHSFRELEQETRSNLDEISARAERNETTATDIETLKQTLEAGLHAQEQAMQKLVTENRSVPASLPAAVKPPPRESFVAVPSAEPAKQTSVDVFVQEHPMPVEVFAEEIEIPANSEAEAQETMLEIPPATPAPLAPVEVFEDVSAVALPEEPRPAPQQPSHNQSLAESKQPSSLSATDDQVPTLNLPAMIHEPVELFPLGDVAIGETEGVHHSGSEIAIGLPMDVTELSQVPVTSEAGKAKADEGKADGTREHSASVAFENVYRFPVPVADVETPNRTDTQPKKRTPSANRHVSPRHSQRRKPSGRIKQVFHKAFNRTFGGLTGKPQSKAATKQRSKPAPAASTDSGADSSVRKSTKPTGKGTAGQPVTAAHRAQPRPHIRSKASNNASPASPRRNAGRGRSRSGSSDRPSKGFLPRLQLPSFKR